jgi:hypothetical protein
LPDDLPKPLIEESQNRLLVFKAAAESAGLPAITHPDVLNSIKQVFAFIRMC